MSRVLAEHVYSLQKAIPEDSAVLYGVDWEEIWSVSSFRELSIPSIHFVVK